MYFTPRPFGTHLNMISFMNFYIDDDLGFLKFQFYDWISSNMFSVLHDFLLKIWLIFWVDKVWQVERNRIIPIWTPKIYCTHIFKVKACFIFATRDLNSDIYFPNVSRVKGPTCSKVLKSVFPQLLPPHHMSLQYTRRWQSINQLLTLNGWPRYGFINLCLFTSWVIQQLVH